MIEQFYTPDQVATILAVHKDTIRKKFRDMPGVLVMRNGRLKKHALLRIPASVLDRYIRSNQKV